MSAVTNEPLADMDYEERLVRFVSSTGKMLIDTARSWEMQIKSVLSHS
jgi:hypothetical protein